MVVQDILDRLLALEAGPRGWTAVRRDAMAEIERLRNLVDDLIPFAINDVEQGLRVAEEGHSDQCDDCMWYESSLEWKKRIDAWQEARRD
jgi:hypothetical protein